MKDLFAGLRIEGKTFAVESVFSGEDILPFPLKAIDMSVPTAVNMPEHHVGIRQQTPPEELLSTMNETGVWNIVQFAQTDIEQKLRVAGRLIQNPRAFLDNPGKQFFELAGSKTEKVKGVGEHRWAFRASSQKRYILNMISSYVFSVPGAKALAESILFVSDELFTNALYNAPFGADDSELDRSTMVFLDPQLSPEMIVSHNSKHLFLGCLDHFGSFDCEEFLKRSSVGSKLDAKKFLKLEMGRGGFGILRIIDLAPDIFIVVEKGKRSFMGCLFPLNASVKKVRQTSRNFFFKSFESLESETNSIVVEKRGSRAILRCVGSFDDKMPVVSIDDAREVSLDLRQVEKIDDGEFKKFMSSLQRVKTIKKISFDFVPMGLVSQLSPVVAGNPKLFEIGSVWDSIVCGACKAAQNIVLKPVETDGAPFKIDAFECPACGAQL